MDPSLLLHLIDRLARDVTSAGHAHGLNPVQWDVLRYLAAANRFSLSPKALTAYFRATKGTVSQTLSTLGKRGLIDKTQSGTDRRSVVLALTPAGLAMLERDPLSGFGTVLAMLAPAELAAVQSSLTKILRLRAHVTGERPFGLCRDCRHFRTGETALHCALLDAPLTLQDSGLICQEQEAA